MCDCDECGRPIGTEDDPMCVLGDQILCRDCFREEAGTEPTDDDEEFV